MSTEAQLWLLKSHQFIDGASFPLSQVLPSAQSLIEKNKGSMWSDGRAHPTRVISKEPKLKGSNSLGISTAQESPVRVPNTSKEWAEWARSRAHADGMLTGSRLRTSMEDVSFSSSIPFYRTETGNQVCKWRLTAFPFLHFSSSHLVPDTKSTLRVIIVPSIAPRALLLFPMLP